MLRLRAATQFGQTVDEAHYVLYGKFLDWSYFDHPPLVGWVHAVFQHLPVNELLQARLPAMLIAIWTSALAYKYLLGKNFSRNNAFYAVAVLNLTPMFNSMAIALLPDTLLMPVTFLVVMATEKLLVATSIRNWLRLGFWLGIAALSKYTAALFVFALVYIFIEQKMWREIRRPGLWLGAMLAFLLSSPVLYWNIKNNFASFQYQTHHVFKFDSEIFRNVGTSYAIQLVSWGIGPFFAALLALAILARNYRKLQTLNTAFVFAAAFFIFFLYVSVGEVLLPHWMLMFFVLMIPIAYGHFSERGRFQKTLAVGALVSALLSLALLFETGFKIFPATATASLYEGVTGWNELLQEAGAKASALPAERKALAVMNWTLGSRAMYYNRTDLPVFVIDTRRDQFDIWNPRSPVGYDLLVIVEAAKKEEHLGHLNCAELTSAGERITFIKNVSVNHFLYYHCANFAGYKE